MVIRFLRRCNHVMLVAIAFVLVVVALFSASLRLHSWHFTGDSSVVKWLPLPSDVSLKADDISIGLSGRDLAIRVKNVHATANPVRNVKLPVLTLASGDVRLNLFRSLRLRQPSFDRLDLDHPTIRLFQHPNGRWWSASSDNDSQNSSFDKHALERWLKNVAGSRARINQGVFELHGLKQTRRVLLSTARIVADEQGNASLKVQARVDGERDTGLSFNASLAPAHDTTGRAELFGDIQQITSIASMLTSSGHYAVHANGQLHAQVNWWGTDQANLRTSLDLDDIDVARTDDLRRRLHLNTFNTSLAAEYKRGQWKGRIARVDATDNAGKPLTLPAYGQLVGSADQLSVRLPSFRVDSANLVWPLLPFSEGLRQTYIDLHPCGEVKASRFDINLRSGVNWRDRLRILADVGGATINAHDEIPALGPVSGSVDMTLRQGSARLSGDKGVGIELPEVFETRWPLRSLSGRLDWTLEDDASTLKGSDITMNRDGAELTGGLFFDSPDNDYKRFNLVLNLRNARLRDARDWIPLRSLSSSLGQWLNTNIHQADVPTASLDMKMLFGNPEGHPELEKHVDFGDANGPNQLHLNMDINNATLGYLEGWPVATGIDGDLALNGENIKGHLKRGQMRGLKAGQGDFSLQNDVLRLGFPVTGDVSQVLSVLKKAPFEDPSLNDQFKRWSARGPVSSTLSLELPFSGKHEGQADLLVSGNVHDAEASLVANQLNFTQVNSTGSFHMQGDRIAIQGAADGHLLGGKVAGRYQLVNGAGGVDFNGDIDALKSMQWLRLAGMAPTTSGSSDYSGHLSVPAQGAVTLDLKTDSRGVTVPLPEPLGKSPDDPRPMNLHMDLTNGIGNVEIQHLVKARWRDQMANGQVWVGRWPSQPQWQEDNGWSIATDLPRFDPMAWVEPIKRLEYDQIGNQNKGSGSGSDGSNSIVINRLAFDTDCLVVNGSCLSPIKLRARMNDRQAWSGTLNSDYLQGNADYDPSAKTPVHVDIKQLVLDPLLDMLKKRQQATPGKDSASKTQASAPQLYKDVLSVPPLQSSSTPFPDSMASVPSGVLDIEHIKARDQSGHAHVRWNSSANALQVPEVEVALAGTHINGQSDWFKASDGSLTTGHGEIKLGDVAKLLKLAGQQKLVTTPGGGTIRFGYAWPGVPWKPQLKTVTGNADIRLGAGNLVALNLTAARVMSLFNIDNLWRRLHLDFSDVTHKGTAFNSVTGKVTLADGRLSNVKPMLIEAPSTTFTLDGDVDLLNQQLDNQLVIRLPVSQALPLGALAVGAPEIGGALLLLHWATGGLLNHATELHYLIHGPWTNPSFNLEQQGNQ